MRLLEECVESYLRQLRVPGVVTELVVLNDHPKQTLTCSAPGVRVVNLPARIATLGEKYNALVEEARGDILCSWDDDDISLPGRIAQAVAEFKLGSAYFNPGGHWCLYKGKPIEPPHRNVVGHNASAYTREAWAKAGKYPAINGPQDLQMDIRLKALGNTAPPLPIEDPVQFQYVYRWRFSHNHLSGNKDTDAAWAAEADREVPEGTFNIQPAWYADYPALCRAHVLANPEKK